MRAIVLTLAAAALVLGGCDDEFIIQPAPTVQDTAALFSLSRAELLGQASAFDFARGQAVRVELPEATGTGAVGWDLALAESGGRLVLVPASAFPGVDSDAGIAVLENPSFQAVDKAPADTAAFVQKQPVPVRTGVVYVVRTRSSGGCVFYAKMQPLEINETAGSLRFEYLLNPNCRDRSLVPTPVDEG